MSLSLTMPAPEPNGFVKTLNNMGYMTSTLDPFSCAFVEFASTAPGPSVDIGAAYGVATEAALRKGARVIANDIDMRHLTILASRMPPSTLKHLKLRTGAFPDEISFAPQSIGAVLLSRVLHFFDGETIERSASVLFEWLACSGKIFVVAETPYLKNFRTFIPIYETRRLAGEKWPGLVNNVKEFAPERGKHLPTQMHFLDPDTLPRTFSEVGFIIEKAQMFPRKDFPEDVQLDGRESVGIIARKP